MRHFIVHPVWTRRLGLVVAIVSLAAAARVFSQQAPPARSDTIAFRIIVVESEDAATRVLEQLMNGENFVALARKLSINPSATNGGLVGPVSVADLRPQIRNVLERLRVGELSGLVRLPTGFGILKIVPDAEATTSRAATSSRLEFGDDQLHVRADGERQRQVRLRPVGICRDRPESAASDARA